MIPGTLECTGELDVFPKYQGTFSLMSPAKIGEDEVIFYSGRIETVAPGMEKEILEFRVKGKLSDSFEENLWKYGEGKISRKQNYSEYEHQGYIHHDVEDVHPIDDDHCIRLWDILPDKDGNEWEVVVCQNEPYWCDTCDDLHDDWIELEKHLFSTKEEAEMKYAELCKKEWNFEKGQ